MLYLEIYPAQKMFFYDRAGQERIHAGIDRARHQNLNRAGAMIRTIARRSLRPARRKRMSELNAEQQIKHLQRVELAKLTGRPKPKLPFAPSKPGEPPRMHAGFLKNFLYYAFDESTRSVVVGPAILPSTAGTVPGVLEYGGVSEGSTIAARPYMRPAEEVLRTQYVRIWKDSIM